MYMWIWIWMWPRERRGVPQGFDSGHASAHGEEGWSGDEAWNIMLWAVWSCRKPFRHGQRPENASNVHTTCDFWQILLFRGPKRLATLAQQIQNTKNTPSTLNDEMCLRINVYKGIWWLCHLMLSRINMSLWNSIDVNWEELLAGAAGRPPAGDLLPLHHPPTGLFDQL